MTSAATLVDNYGRQMRRTATLYHPTEQEREIHRLREALEPFSKHGEKLKTELSDVPDEHIHDGISMRHWRIAARVGRPQQ